MKSILQQVSAHSSPHIIVVGSMILDRYSYGNATRISREAPVLVFKEDHTVPWCGGAANVACNIVAAGWDVTLIGLVGRDAGAAQFKTLLREKNIATTHVLESEHRTTTQKNRIVCERQQLLRIDHEPTSVKLTDAERAQLVAAVESVVRHGSMLIISDYGDGYADRTLMHAIRECVRSRGAKILVDPRGPDLYAYHGADVIKPNYDEFLAMATYCGFSQVDDTNFEVVARSVRSYFDVQTLVVTRGSRGMVAVTSDTIYAEPAYQKEIRDITGAGDTACAYLALGFSAGCTIPEVLKLASSACAVAVMHEKNYPVSLAEIDACEQAKQQTSRIIERWDDVAMLVDQARAAGKKIVFTNGCFDILHAGHVFLLQEAKKQGDFLIVALNSDASVRGLKGHGRPVNSLEDRQRVIAGLASVDLVCSFEQATPEALMARIRPDVVVKGGDYQAHLLPGYELVTGYGGVFKIIDLVPGRSTTNIIRATQVHKIA